MFGRVVGGLGGLGACGGGFGFWGGLFGGLKGRLQNLSGRSFLVALKAWLLYVLFALAVFLSDFFCTAKDEGLLHELLVLKGVQFLLILALRV